MNCPFLSPVESFILLALLKMNGRKTGSFVTYKGKTATQDAISETKTTLTGSSFPEINRLNLHDLRKFIF